MTKHQSGNNTENFNPPKVSSLTPQPPQIHLPEYLYHLQRDMEVRPTENLTNQGEHHFNESLLTLLNGQ